MTDRFFVHCVSQEEETLLYALALAHQPTPKLLSAMLVTDDLTAELGQLARRYDFVLAAERQLHAVVKGYTLEKLLSRQNYELPQVRLMNERAVNFLQVEQKRLEERCLNLELCFEDEVWTATTLALIYHTFWLEEESGWDTLLPILTSALYYDRRFALTLLNEIEILANPLIKRKQWYKAIGNSLHNPNDYQAKGQLLRTLQNTASNWPPSTHHAETQVLLLLLQGQQQRHLKNYEAAFNMFEPLIPTVQKTFAHLQERVADDLYDLSNNLMWPDNAAGATYSDTAHQALESAVLLAPHNADIHYYLGVSYKESNQLNEAIAAFQQAIALDEKYATPHHGLGLIYRALGRNEEAMAAFQQAIALDEKFAYPHHGLGNIYRDLGRNEEAIAAYEQAIALDEKDVYAHHGLGIVYRDLGRNEEAMAAYEQAIALDEKLAAPHHGLGNIYRALGRNEEAIAAYGQAIALDEKDAYPHQALGTMFQLSRDYASALSAFQRVVELEPNVASFQSSLALVHRQMGNETAYANHLSQARTLMEKEDDYNKACIESIAGNIDEALIYLKQALQKSPGSKTWAASDPDLIPLHGHPEFERLLAS